ncbi:MAG: hypothetical protein K0U37_07545 [Gammaproteobacteria bacterium]|nr:hypothetical protein [Gammaproteobacteria bacterium]
MKAKTISTAILGFTCFTLTSAAFAMNDPCMKQVSMRFSAENWVNSQTALVSIALSASVPANQVDTLTETIKTKLAANSNVKDWQLINLTRNESDSGLMAITGQAVARLNNNELSALQAKLKALNKPGEKYTIDNIDYQPDLETINKAKSLLRTNLYTQIINGEKELNTALPKANSPYQIYTIMFNDASMSEPVAFVASKVRTARSNNAIKNTSLSGKMRMSASVTYGTQMPNCNVDNDAKH